MDGSPIGFDNVYAVTALSIEKAMVEQQYWCHIITIDEYHWKVEIIDNMISFFSSWLPYQKEMEKNARRQT